MKNNNVYMFGILQKHKLKIEQYICSNATYVIKGLKFILILFLMVTAQTVFSQNDFRITIRTTSPNESFTIPTIGGGYDYDVRWRDAYESGGVTIITAHEEGFTANASHTYDQPGEYTISIKGDFPRIHFANSGDKSKVIAIEQWGNISWMSMADAFYGCSNMVVNATDAPDLSQVTSLANMFKECTQVDFSLGNWNVSTITNMSGMFTGATLSSSNYDTTLNQWSPQNLQSNVTFDAGNSTYCIAYQSHNFITHPTEGNNWTIIDGGQVCDEDKFITTWQTTAANQSITIPTTGSGYDYTINWGDGNVSLSQTGNAVHTYADAGTYTVSIWGTFPRIRFNADNNATKLQRIDRWGNLQWDSMFFAFEGCSNLILNADDSPDLSLVTLMSGMFKGTTQLTDTKDQIGFWDVSSVLYMQQVFMDSGFNEDISGWNMSSVELMDSMFQNATNFNQDISGWTTTSAVSLLNMFKDATAFNQNLGDWDITNVISMYDMLDGTSLSSTNYDTILVGWATDSSTSASDGIDDVPSDVYFGAGTTVYCFGSASRNTLSNVPYNWTITDGGQSCSILETDKFITTWYVASQFPAGRRITIPTSGLGYLYNVEWGDGTISEGVTGDVTHEYGNSGTYTVKISGFFPQIVMFNSDYNGYNRIRSIEQWGNIKWRSMFRAFRDCRNLVLNATDVPDLSQATSMYQMFYNAEAFKDNGGSIGAWDVSNIETMFQTFQNTEFNSNINAWNVENVVDFTNMFSLCADYNQPMDNWTLTNAEILTGMFGSAIVFNQDISMWNTSGVTDMKRMFKGASAFNIDISGWDVSSVIRFDEMFRNTDTFNQSLNGWVLSSATQLSRMFEEATAFNADLSGWNVSNVTNFDLMFQGATAFNQDISGWQLTSAKELNSMFYEATAFNQDISGWDVTGVERFDYMFYGATAFNQPVGNWTTTSAINLNNMFNGATAFDQNLGEWDISNVNNMLYMLDNSGLTPFNYDLALIGWATQDGDEAQIPTNIPLGAMGIYYCTAEDERNMLDNAPYNWTIVDEGLDCYNEADKFITTWMVTNPGESITIPTTGSGYAFHVEWGDGTVDELVTQSITHQYSNSGLKTIKISGAFPRFYLQDSPETNWDKLKRIEQWGTIVWQNMNDAFAQATSLTINATDAPDLSGVTSLEGLFFNCNNLQSPDLSNWDMSNITNVSSMFAGCDNFNGTIGNWDIGNVTHFNAMFLGCGSFNQDLSAWNIGEHTEDSINMERMFSGTEMFNQNLGAWDLSKVTDMTSMLDDSGLSAQNYDFTLMGWAMLEGDENQIPQDITLGALGLSYCISGPERTLLEDTYNWTITGDTANCPEAEQFITTWTTTEANQNIRINRYSSTYTYNYAIDWGDGTIEYNLTGDATHSYNQAGTYYVKISGVFPSITLLGTNVQVKDRLATIEQWGNIQWETMQYAFIQARNLNVVATDAPDLSRVNSIAGMFALCSNLQSPDLSGWDTSNVNVMSEAFRNCTSFNGNISNWDVGNVDRFDIMFGNCDAFNRDISGWNIGVGVEGAIDMGLMFFSADVFDQNLGSWDMSKVTNAVDMLDGTGLSVQNYDATLIGWAAQEDLVADLVLGADGLQYCQGETGRTILTSAPNNWTIDGDEMACGIDAFVTTWETTGVGESIEIPIFDSGSLTYNYNIDWGDGTIEENVTTSALHSYATPGMHTIRITGDFPRIYINLGGDKDKLRSIDQWGNIQWDSMEGAFYGCTNLVLNATDTPDLSNVISMSQMFRQCTNFVDNGGFIGNWNVSNVEDFSLMFYLNSNFNSNIGGWNMASATNLGAMFRGAFEFNQPIGSWQVSSVTGFSEMFAFAWKFDQDLSGWDVSSGEYFTRMFREARDFNQNIGNWNVEMAKDLTYMFSGADAFDQNIGNWKFNSLIINQFYANGIYGMLNDCGMSVENYDATLMGWATNDEMSTGITVGVSGLRYCAGEEARTLLTSPPYNWTFQGDGLSPTCKAVVLVNAYLQGAASNPNTGEEGLMRDDLRVNSLIPLTSPYGDGLIADASVFTVVGTDAIIDWVWVELRDKNDNSIVIDSKSALLQRDGDVVSVDGESSLYFDIAPDSYYVSVNHRNHLGIISNSVVALSSTITAVDLSSDPNAVAGGTNSVTLLSNGKYGMYTGDYDANVQIQNIDANAVIQLIGDSGYDAADMDINSQVQNTDVNALINPNIGRGQQFRVSESAEMLSSNMTLSFANAQITNDGVNDYYEADIMIESTGNMYVGSGQVYLEYNTAAFGDNISTANAIEYSQPSGSILGFAWPGVPFATPAYKDFVMNDNTASRVSLSFQQNVALVGLEAEPAALEINSTPKLLFHIKIKYIDSNEDTNMCFYSEGVFQDQFFTACGGISIADCTNLPGEQITDDTYDCAAAGVDTLGISEVKDNTLFLYPNPVNTSFYIKGLMAESSVRVYDLNGRVITEQRVEDDKAIDMSRYEDGVYLVEITTENTSVTKRLIKKSN